MPTSPAWYRYIKESDDVAQEMETDIKLLIKRQAKEACQLMKDDLYKQDVWLWDLDWTPTELKVKKAKPPKNQKDQNSDDPMFAQIDDTEFERLEKKFFPLVRQVENLYKSQPRCPGYPKWYSELCDGYHPAYLPNPIDVGTGKTIVPKVFTTKKLEFIVHN